MINPDLTKYISQLRSTNVPEETIREQLIKNGWPEDEVITALDPLTSPGSTILPPPPVPRFSMWISFQYVLLFITLWIWSIALGGIWNYAITKYIPDAITKGSSYNFSAMRGVIFLPAYLAAIIVAYPFFVALFISLNKHVEVNPGVRNIKTRKFLMYFTMVVNFLYMISQLITTVIGFLSANISTSTIPHLIVNLLIPGSICLYLLREVKEDRKTTV
ncbi:hypothetical protein COT87_03215 [Candidatus Collierbacteria bacterium CG10_big_fil_rev_8_21_14_0_10_44_9]|uniref:DUF5671 domain-containing protein n=1 Tax=Candidatus Collierbacteria bacterium CG10_big_fil_rev_8_21_14_0_10_44_9 TaxID=1974535 RepID=A0A2H0VI32_9BACT|nr:MAG: hypothetical protein COT87_03215 [Candidatus Collierbacteria bacterium CG10_big_fil_rev_8_21_14_0_10_44_9]